MSRAYFRYAILAATLTILSVAGCGHRRAPTQHAFFDLAQPAQAATAPPFNGTRTSPWAVTRSGTYTFNQGTTIRLNAAQSKKLNAVDIKADNVIIENLTVQGGYRGFSVQRHRNFTLRNCTAKGCGIPTSGHTHGGSNFIFIDSSGGTLDHCQSIDPVGEHCLYLAQSSSNYNFITCVFQDTAAHQNPTYQGVFQINSESGSQAVKITADDCEFRASPRVDAIAVMGGGTSSEPVSITNSRVTGGRRVISTDFSAGRDSYLLLKNTTVSGAKIVQQNGSWVHQEN